MTHTSSAGSSILAVAATAFLLAAVAVSGVAAGSDHPVLGRWVVEAQPGGAVWAFQESGQLILTGPGDIISEGTWTEGAAEGAFDAVIEVTVSGQSLRLLGQVSPDARGVAMYVTATDPTKPDDWTPWPPESRLSGHPLGMMVEETPPPTEPPLECLRPQWVDGLVDWDRCDEALSTG